MRTRSPVILENGSLLGVALIAAVAACGDAGRQADTVAGASAAVQGDAAGAMARAPTVYFGEFRSGQAWQALLLRVSDSLGAALYDPPGLSSVCPGSGADSAMLGWRVRGADARGYLVRVAVDGASLNGSVVTEPSAINSARDSAALRLMSISRGSNAAAPQAGVFSSLSAHGETGDNVGAELVLADSGGGYVGALTVGEGSRSVPYALQNVRVGGDTTFMRVISEYGPREYIATVHADSLTLALKGSRLVRFAMRRVATIEQFFLQHASDRCGR